MRLDVRNQTNSLDSKIVAQFEISKWLASCASKTMADFNTWLKQLM